MKTAVSFYDIDKITQGDPKVMKELLAVFIKQNKEHSHLIKEYVATRQWDMLKKTAHKLKSSLALVGMMDHRQMAEDLEQHAGKDLRQTTEWVNELAHATELAVNEAEKRLKNIS